MFELSAFTVPLRQSLSEEFMNVVQQIKQATATVLTEHFALATQPDEVQVNVTKPEFEGDYTVVLFPFVKPMRKSPEQVGQLIGEILLAHNSAFFERFQVIKGFLNLTISQNHWQQTLKALFQQPQIGVSAKNGKKVMVEYSSPNTNKPLHLGHLRNNFLGWSVAAILDAAGYDVTKTCIVNDRGVHICKSMIAWQLFANGATPATTGQKGDHFVGDYYVKFNDAYKAEIAELEASGLSKDEAEKQAPIMLATQQMLLDWEAGKPEVISLWKTMNSWVYEGFDATYAAIGSDFQKTYYESNTYLLGKDLVEQGLEMGVFFKKEDGSVWIDLTEEGLDQKLVLRKDGTSVYITQDLGLADLKYKEFGCDKSIYVIGDEQNYHMKVLQLIMKKLNAPYADGIYHLSYGMVELPTGKMKSREGTVVDADDLVAEMINIAAEHTAALGKTDGFTTDELTELYNTIGLGALKFYLVRVDPKKKMIFNPEESIDFHGFTGPFIQYTHARIKSIIRKGNQQENAQWYDVELSPKEKELLRLLEQCNHTVQEAAQNFDPSLLANYAFAVAKTFNSFYAEHSVLNAESDALRAMRLQLSAITAKVLSLNLQLLGISAPERM